MAIGTVHESLGFSLSENNLYYDSLSQKAQASLYLRYAFSFCRPIVSSPNAIGSYIPFVVVSLMWLHLQSKVIRFTICLYCRSLKGVVLMLYRRCKNRITANRIDQIAVNALETNSNGDLTQSLDL
jgi:hypothetical protein